MSNLIRPACLWARAAVSLFALAPIMFFGVGCAAPSACVGGIGSCNGTSLPSLYAIIDPSGSQANQIDRQVADVRAIASRGPAEITIVLLGERPATSKIVTRVSLPDIDESDPNALSTRTALLGKLDDVVRKALGRPTSSSDHWGALQLVHDNARQRAIGAAVDVFVLGDSEPCVPDVCWTRKVPSPSEAVKRVRQAYGPLNYEDMRVTFVLGGDTGAARKSTSYVSQLSAAVVAVCKSARARSCAASSHVAQVTS